MIEFWHDFLFDKATFGTTIFLLMLFLGLGGIIYGMLKEEKKK